MVIEKIKELEEIEARAAELKAHIESERKAELASLPGKYGFDSAADFIKAFKAAIGVIRKPRGKAKGTAPKAGKKRTRAKITDEIRQQVKALAESGKSGAEISAATGISLPSVQNIKKQLGLVRSRS